MALLAEKDRETLTKRFGQLTKPVRLVMFTQEFECPSCRNTRELLEETASLSGKIDLAVYDLVKDQQKAETYSVQLVPAVIVEGEKDHGIRFFGAPAGYEFSSLVEDILAVGTGTIPLSQASREKLASLTQPLHIQVFVTPSCPYCPRAVHTAHMLAIASDNITADMVMAPEFPHLANRYDVMAVPKVIINEKISFEGAVPEEEFVNFLMQAAG
jgi:glutaredoxin-like protein